MKTLDMKNADTTGTVPKELRSPRGKLVYLYLESAGDATVSEMSEALRMRKLALYSVLRTLREDDLVTESDGQYAPTDSDTVVSRV